MKLNNLINPECIIIKIFNMNSILKNLLYKNFIDHFINGLLILSIIMDANNSFLILDDELSEFKREVKSVVIGFPKAKKSDLTLNSFHFELLSHLFES